MSGPVDSVHVYALTWISATLYEVPFTRCVSVFSRTNAPLTPVYAELCRYSQSPPVFFRLSPSSTRHHRSAQLLRHSSHKPSYSTLLEFALPPPQYQGPLPRSRECNLRGADAAEEREPLQSPCILHPVTPNGKLGRNLATRVRYKCGVDIPVSPYYLAARRLLPRALSI